MTTVLTVADLHRNSVLLRELRDAVAKHKPDLVALVGDFLHGFDDEEGRETTAVCAEMLSQLACPEIVCVRGNHEDSAWLQFAQAWQKLGRPLHALHGEAFSYGPLTLIAFPCLMGDETAFVGDRAPLPLELDKWLPEVMLKAGRAARTLWLMHEPPVGNPLSQAGSLVEGNPDWNSAIERFRPWITISGHDHATPIKRKRWYHRLDATVCVNVGQSDRGPLHYCVVEAEFAGEASGLPTTMNVTAYPWNETVTLPSGKPEKR